MNFNNISHAYTTTVSVNYVYSTTDIAIPEGYDYVAFRVPMMGEWFLSQGPRNQVGVVCERTTECGFHSDQARIILKPKPLPRRFLIEQVSREEYAKLSEAVQPRVPDVYNIDGAGRDNLRHFKIVKEVK